MNYDSRADTQAHIERVDALLTQVCLNLMHRAEIHDQSKLEDPEKSAFDTMTPRLRGLTYGSDEYRATLREMKPAIQHHYAHNSHHPEHYADGIQGMSLLDIIEMLMDWKAASERHDNGDIVRSIDQNAERFGYGEDLRAIFHNTAREMGWA